MAPMALMITSASGTPLAAAAAIHTRVSSGGAPATARLSPLGSGALSGRVALMRAVVASPGGAPMPLSRRRCTTGNDQSPPLDSEAFNRRMHQFRKTYELATATNIIAKKCVTLLGAMVAYHKSDRSNHALHKSVQDTKEKVYRIGESFVEVEMQCDNGYVSPKCIGVAMDGLKGMVEIFVVKGGDTWGLADCPRQCSDDTDAYLKELVESFQKLFVEVENNYIEKHPWYKNDVLSRRQL